MSVSVDAIIYAPLEEEYVALQRVFKPIEQIDGSAYTGFTSTTDQNRALIIIAGFEWGNAKSQEIWEEVLSRYTPKIALCAGIAGAISKDAKLGYVFYSSKIIDLTQRQKQSKDDNGIMRTAYDPIEKECPQNLRTIINKMRLSIDKASPYNKWQASCELRNNGPLALVNTAALGQASATFAKPKAQEGSIASVNAVLADAIAVEDVKKCGRKISCVDTESAGFIKVINEHASIQPLVIRGISDYADDTKTDLEESFKELFRDIAISNVASFIGINIDNLIDGCTHLYQIKSATAPPTNIVKLDKAISDNEKKMRDELHSRSILYKAIGADDKLPVPRLRYPEDADAVADKAKPLELEIEDVLETNDRVLVEVASNYPDTALPWLYANLLCHTNIHDKFTVPVIIDYEEFGPPQNTLMAHLKNNNLEKIANNTHYQIVFIFPEFRVNSSSKPKFLANCLENFTNASVLAFSDKHEDNIYSNNFVTEISPEVVSVQGISFRSLTRFVNTQLDLGLAESEVVATRLLSTFSNHRLKLHPTYLASITKDTLTSFLDANQRGELIELCVATLLSMLVSGDKAKVILTRTAREDFLSELAVEIYARKRTYTKQELEDYVGDLAKRMGFAIVPSQFIRDYQSSGILTFERGRAQIAVPVIKSYMLAKGLTGKPKEAIQYFDPYKDGFDYSTFDLYCEYSKELPVYEQISAGLDDSILFFEEKLKHHTNLVADGKYKSRFLEKTLNLTDLSEDMNKQAQKLVEATTLVDEKQAQLDVQQRVSKTKSAREVSIADERIFENEWRATRRFAAATILLGAAAERLNNKQKVELISRILVLGEAMVTDLLTLRAQFDFDQAVEDVGASMIKAEGLEFKDAADKEAFHNFVKVAIADWDFNEALHPLIVFSNLLCETGRTNVLLAPLNECDPKTDLQEFLRSCWAFDMDPVQEKKKPNKLSKRLGYSPFLRLAFSILFYHRSYWYHSKQENRKSIADGVNLILKKLSLKQDIPEKSKEDST